MKKILILVLKKLGLFESLDKLYVKMFAKIRIRKFLERGGEFILLGDAIFGRRKFRCRKL